MAPGVCPGSSERPKEGHTCRSHRQETSPPLPLQDWGGGEGVSAKGLSVSDPWTESAMKSRRGLLGTTTLSCLPWHVWAPQARSEAEGGGRSCLVRQSSRGSLGGWLMAF